MTERGDRVKLMYQRDPYTRIAPGSYGTVTRIDHRGTVHVQWDGLQWGGDTKHSELVAGEDHWIVVPRQGVRLVE
jgi:Domain of unknown function (DUF4314)